MKKKPPQLETFAIIGLFADGNTYQFALTEDTKRAILNMIVMIEGTVKIFDKPIVGVTLSKD